ncbi:AraC family transcriptional regulator [Candidatus Darwinibacter acetoxidans]|jgi:AraC family transcriptional regulator
MNYRDHIARAVEYMEENLTSELDLDSCARVSGYSKYYFLRVFKEVTGLTPADYIRKRRLSEIAKRICQTDEPISAIAFAYGFNSKENFTRAFKAEHNILPTEYRRAQNSLLLYEPLALEQKPFSVLPELVTIDAFSLTVYRSDEEDPPKFWNEYNARKLSLRLSGGKNCEDFGVSVVNTHGGNLDYFIGIRTEDAVGDTAGTEELLIPGGLYALFKTPPATQADFVNTIRRTWQYILQVWLPQSGYTHAGSCDFESYLETSRQFSERIYIPLKAKQGGQQSEKT